MHYLSNCVPKALPAKLARVMDTFISVNQLTFLKGTLLVYGVMIVNELVDWAKKTKRDCLILKLDFEKTCDFVS